MNYGREAGFVENWVPGSADRLVWATEDDYGFWNREASVDSTNSNHDSLQSQFRSGSEAPNKKSKPGDLTSTNRSKGKLFFKTKLCCKFWAGTCPYITNCNFAHSMEELRRPPPNWHEIVAARVEERAACAEPREEFQIPSLGSAFVGETLRSYKGRHCRKFNTDEGCPYGEKCTFLHDEQSKARESVAISLVTGAAGDGGGYVTGNGGSNSNMKPSNWKTRICKKWELTGYCPFGNKCHFAHGAAELHRYSGGLAETDGKDSFSPQNQKQEPVPSKTAVDTVVASANSVPHLDGYQVGFPAQRWSNVIQRTGLMPHQKWKGPDKISRIYGDWIDIE